MCWPTVLWTHGIGLTLEFFPWYFPYKREHCKSTGYGIVLYWKRDCESVKRKCSGFAAGCIPSSFWTAIKGLANFFVDVAHRLGEPRYICVSLYCFNLFCILFIDIIVYLLLLCGPVFLTSNALQTMSILINKIIK